MGGYIDLLTSLPKPKRDVKARAEGKDAEVVRISRQYGWEYFDGDRKYGYGGFRYDGRWLPVAKDIAGFFDLKNGDKVLDVGCAKGFLVNDFGIIGMDSSGLDISPYAICACPYEKTRQRLICGSADKLPYDDKCFDLIVSINTLHNLARDGIIRALKEIERVGKGKSYIVVDSYYTPEQKAIFEGWVLTAQWYGYPNEWEELFKEAGYTGYYSWTIT